MGFLHVKGDAVFSPEYPQTLKEIAGKAGLPPETTMGHFFVSSALAQNVPGRDVQAIAGHADFRTTAQIYGHLMEGAQIEAAKKETFIALKCLPINCGAMGWAFESPRGH